jgi:hypothetical protein
MAEGRGKTKGRIMLTLLKDDVRLKAKGWLIWDVDFRDEAGVDKEVQTFMDRHAKPESGKKGAAVDPKEESTLGEAKDVFTLRGAVTDENNHPLGGAVVNIVRQTFAKNSVQPRIETFGMVKTDAAGRFAIPRLYPVWNGESRAGFILYFSAPGRAARSLFVDRNFDPKTATKIILPTGANAKVFVPTFHVVVESAKGITVLEGREGIQGFSRIVGANSKELDEQELIQRFEELRIRQTGKDPGGIK